MNGICKDAIKGGSKTTLIFEVSNGEYIINSRKVAIDSDGLLEFKGGKFTIESERGDAIKSSPMDSDKGSLGMIMINDGDFKIRCFNDAFTAKNNIVIKDGKFDIITETGSGSKTFNKEKGSAKGFKSTSNETGCGIYIYSGEFTIDSADDSIHSNRDLTILAGKYNISSKDDGIVAKWHLILGKKNDPNEKLQITINKSYEAIEGMTITIFSGKIRCKSKDDGMNASHDKQEEIDQPDFYIRQGGASLIFECKAIKLSGDLKEQADVDVIMEELKNKLVEKRWKLKNGHKQYLSSPKNEGIGQLVAHIERLENGTFKWDPQIPEETLYYPILVLESREIIQQSLSAIINEWYYDLLKSKLSISLKKCQPLIVMTIKTLFLYSDLFKKDGFGYYLDKFIYDCKRMTNGHPSMSAFENFDGWMQCHYKSNKQSYYEETIRMLQ